MFDFKRHFTSIKSSFILKLRFEHTIPHKLKKRSINELEPGIVVKAI